MDFDEALSEAVRQRIVTCWPCAEEGKGAVFGPHGTRCRNGHQLPTIGDEEFELMQQLALAFAHLDKDR